MQPMQLTTDWITIGTAGPTVDGRKISEQMLMEAAENYDPDEYTAVISSDHMLWMFGNFGEVCKVRTSTDKKDRTILQAKIHPNRKLIEMNALGQRLHTSMELDSDFAGSGKAYLMGLAITDEPASLGTSQLKFSRTENIKSLMIGNPEELETIHFNQTDTPKDPEISFFKSLFQKLGTELNSSETSEPVEVEEMTEEQFKALKDLHEKQLTATENLATLLNAKGDENGDGEEQEESKKGEEKKGENGEEIKAFMNDVTSQLTSLTEKLEKATAGQPGTRIPQNTGAGSEATFI